MTNDATRWTVKGWDDEHIEYEDEEGKWVAWEDHRDLLQAAVAAAYEDAAKGAESRITGNGHDGPRDGITIKHESELPPSTPSQET